MGTVRLGVKQKASALAVSKRSSRSEADNSWGCLLARKRSDAST